MKKIFLHKGVIKLRSHLARKLLYIAALL